MDVNHEVLGDFRISNVPVMASWRIDKNTSLSMGVGFPLVKGEVLDNELREETENLSPSWVIGATRGIRLLTVGDFSLDLASKSYIFYDGSWNAVSTLELLLAF
jgi:hypothetical protein